MKILYAVHHFPPNYNGGAEWRAHRTATTMKKKGYSVSVICIEQISFGESKKIEVQKENFGDFPVYRLHMQLDVRPDRLGYLYQNQELGNVISELLEDTHADLFHLFGGYLLNVNALQSAREQDVPSIVSLTDFWYICPRIQMIRSNGQICPFPIEEWTCARCLGEEKRRYSWPGRLIPGVMEYFWKHQSHTLDDLRERMDLLISELNQTQLIVSPSNFVRDAYIQHGVIPEKIIYSRQGVDLSTFPNVFPAKQKKGILRVGYIGQIAEIKGVHILIEAITKLKSEPVHLVIYGDLTKNPAYVERLRNIVEDETKIEFRGLFDRHKLMQVMENIDVLVVPSLWYENSPNVIQEAFATKTPVITSDLGGMAELIKHRENGLLFLAGDNTALAEQIRALIDESGLLEKLHKGIMPVKSVEIEMAELEEIYLSQTRKAKTDAHRH
jgi:glycosyltransferase involved in cell wall biosynthesis